MVYTNLSSEVHLKSHIGCGNDKFFDATKITSDYNIVTHVINFNETGINKTVNVERVIGDVIFSTIEKATHIDLDLSFIIDTDAIGSETITDVTHNLGDYKSVGDYYSYSEDDLKKRHRLALIWKDGTSQYMKVYYNAYLLNMSINNSDSLEVTAKFRVPIMDIETGSANYYEYEGTSSSTALATIDTSMNW